MGEPAFEPDTSASEVVEAAGTTLATLRGDAGRGEALEAMGEGGAVVAERLADTLDEYVRAAGHEPGE